MFTGKPGGKSPEMFVQTGLFVMLSNPVTFQARGWVLMFDKATYNT
jgi:hypothetical protein